MFLKLPEEQQDILNCKVYQPYFITFSTVRQFMDEPEQELSIM
jgi:hypothetical protein